MNTLVKNCYRNTLIVPNKPSLFFLKLFTEYGRLAMDEIFQKPFQVQC